MPEYYTAYNDRYLQVHMRNLQWADSAPSPIVAEALAQYGIGRGSRILELGCGEGRDAVYLLKQGYDVLATDVSTEAIRYCREQFPDYAEHFHVLDCVAGALDAKFDFIYAVAVVHMLVEDNDRARFYGFLRKHLNPGGIALVCSMGDGEITCRTDPRQAFALRERLHSQTGQTLSIAATTCRMVSTDEFRQEIEAGGLRIREAGLTETVPGFSSMLFAIMESE